MRESLALPFRLSLLLRLPSLLKFFIKVIYVFVIIPLWKKKSQSCFLFQFSFNRHKSQCTPPGGGGACFILS